MHWTAAQPGALDAERELILTAQTPGEIVFLSAADTDLASVAAAWIPRFGARLRLAHAGPLRQPVAADHYLEHVIRHARVVVLRLLGGRAYFPHLIQALDDLRDDAPRPQLLVLSGSGQDEPSDLSDFPEAIGARMTRFFQEGGRENISRAGLCLELILAGEREHLPEPEPMPDFGIYRRSTVQTGREIWLCFYRAWYQADDLAVVDALQTALEARGFAVTLFYSLSLRQPAAQAELLRRAEVCAPRVIITLQSFSLCLNDGERLSFLDRIGCPVLQLPVALSSRESWLKNLAGLAPAEVAMNVALPEIDGRIFGSVLGFKEEDVLVPEAQFTVKRLQPDLTQIAAGAELAHHWARLSELDNAEKKVAIILSNYPNRDGRIGNGVGLDTPASTVNLLRALSTAGYVVGPLPADGEELMNWLQKGITNDPEHSYGKTAAQSVDRQELESCIAELPLSRREELASHWPDMGESSVPVAGIQLGNVFLGIQPPRGFSQQPGAIYHSPTLPPPPQYLAFYFWVRERFRADAIVHLGKHGNLEWLPGRAVALGGDDYPRICIGALPHIYPFIVNNPGEGTQAKRRTAAVIIDHLTPPLTRSGLYGDLEKMERLLEEHAHCLTLYPSRAGELEREIEQLLSESSWGAEVPGAAKSVEAIGNFLCEIKESQIRSGLHILGETPKAEKRVDFLLSLLRLPSAERPGLLESISGRSLENLSSIERDNLELRARAWIADACCHAAVVEELDALQKLRLLVRQQLLPRLAKCSDELDHCLLA